MALKVKLFSDCAYEAWKTKSNKKRKEELQKAVIDEEAEEEGPMPLVILVNKFCTHFSP